MWGKSIAFFSNADFTAIINHQSWSSIDIVLLQNICSITVCHCDDNTEMTRGKNCYFGASISSGYDQIYWWKAKRQLLFISPCACCGLPHLFSSRYVDEHTVIGVCKCIDCIADQHILIGADEGIYTLNLNELHESSMELVSYTTVCLFHALLIKGQHASFSTFIQLQQHWTCSKLECWSPHQIRFCVPAVLVPNQCDFYWFPLSVFHGIWHCCW